MAKQTDLDRTYMTCAYAMAQLSHAVRRKVGSIIVAPPPFDGIIAEGVNGTPSGFDNCCETEEFDPLCIDGPIDRAKPRLVTKDICLHAESNAIAKLARNTHSSVGATLYCTLSPCLECAKLIVQARIARVVYAEQYPYPGHTGEVRAMGLELLEEAGIQVDNFPLHCNHVDDDELNIQDEGLYRDDEEPWRGKNHP